MTVRLGTSSLILRPPPSVASVAQTAAHMPFLVRLQRCCSCSSYYYLTVSTTAQGELFEWGLLNEQVPAPRPVTIPGKTGIRFREVFSNAFATYASSQELRNGQPITELYHIGSWLASPVKLPESMVLRSLGNSSNTTYLYSITRELYELQAATVTRCDAQTGVSFFPSFFLLLFFSLLITPLVSPCNCFHAVLCRR